MNGLNHQEMVQEAVKSQFKGKKEKTSKIVPRYPSTPEREYRRICIAFTRILNEAVKESMPDIAAACYETRSDDARMDGGNDFGQKLQAAFNKIAAKIEKALAAFGLEDKIKNIGNMANNRSIAEWKRIVNKTFGINILDDYYKGDLYASEINQWVADNVSMIKSIPNEMLGDMQELIMQGYLEGKSVTALKKEIQETYNVSKSKAEMIARDQIGTLTGQLAKMQQQDAGVKKYKWSTSRDSRVRECHAELEGKIFDWDDPPEMWYYTKSKGRVYTGRYCCPGEDYECRCCAIPVFDYQTIDLPIGGEEK